MIPGASAEENIRFLPFAVVFLQPILCLRYQLTSPGSRVSKLYCTSHSGSTPCLAATLDQLSRSPTLYGRPPVGRYDAGKAFFGSLMTIAPPRAHSCAG